MSPKAKKTKLTQIDTSQRTLSGWLSKSSAKPAGKNDMKIQPKGKQPLNIHTKRRASSYSNHSDNEKASNKTLTVRNTTSRKFNSTNSDDLSTSKKKKHDNCKQTVEEAESQNIDSSESLVKKNSSSQSWDEIFKCVEEFYISNNATTKKHHKEKSKKLNGHNHTADNKNGEKRKMETKKTSTKMLDRLNSANSDDLPTFKEKKRDKNRKQITEKAESQNIDSSTLMVKKNSSSQSRDKIFEPTEELNTNKNVTRKRHREKSEKITRDNRTVSNKDTEKKMAKKVSTKVLRRFNSASSDELPTFRGKVPRKGPKQTEAFKKYGVIVPLMDEIIADQQQLSNYKIQVEEAQSLSEPSFKIPSSPKKAKIVEKSFDCKHLSLGDIRKHFNDNISFLSDILKGKKFSDRHRRYFDKKSLLNSLTLKDLTYSTSTILFNFEQLDYMISLMQEEFDPEDKKTCYFFKVLVPELCLKIFMDTYDMNKRTATQYLDNCPI